MLYRGSVKAVKTYVFRQMLLEGNQLHVAEQCTEKPTCIESSIKGKNTEVTLLILNNCIVSFKQKAPNKRKHRTEKLTGGF